MWLSIVLKSLTERNALMLLLTYFIGPNQANIFKVANESALFFYRTALNTIGTNDTALLTYAKIHTSPINHASFQHLQQKITTLCLIMSALFIPICISKWYAYTHIRSAHLFFIITMCYLLEVFLSPYERILEVDQEYTLLFKGYIPYCILLALILMSQAVAPMGLISTIIAVHTARTVSSVLLALYARKHYQVHHTAVLYGSTAKT